jgi:hypothetical protein
VRNLTASPLAGPRLIGEPTCTGPAAGTLTTPVPVADFSPQARTHEPHATTDQIVRMDTLALVHRVRLAEVVRLSYGCAPWDLSHDEAARLCSPTHFALLVADAQARGPLTVAEASHG